MPLDRVRTVIDGVAGAPFYTNVYFSNASGANQAQQVIDKMRAFWDVIKGTILTGLTGTIEGEVPVIDPVNGKMTGVHTGTPYNFTATGVGTAMPGYVQGLVRLHTGGFVNGHNVHGRIFIPGNLEENNATGRPSSPYLTLLQQAATALNTPPPVLQVWARPLKAPGTGTILREGSQHTVISTSTWAEWAVLRSRRSGA